MSRSSLEVVSSTIDEGGAAGAAVVNSNGSSAISFVTYGECLKNHAISTGGHIIDGCREFMQRGNEGNDIYICIACGCHRNYHKKEVHTEAVCDCNVDVLFPADDDEASPSPMAPAPAPAPSPPATADN